MRVVVAALVMIATGSLVHADDRDAAAALERGIASYRQGLTLQAEGRAGNGDPDKLKAAHAAFEEALREYETAYRRSNEIEVLVNIGAAQRRLERYRDATQTLELYLSKAQGVTPERAAIINTELAQIKALLVDVRVDVRGEGAQLVIDGPLGTEKVTPDGKPLQLDPGKYRFTGVVIDRGRRFERSEQVELKAGTPFALDLTPPTTTTFVVTTRPAGARIALDDEIIGRSPLDVSALANTPHRLRATLPGHYDATLERDGEPATRIPIAFDLVEYPWYRKRTTWIVAGGALAVAAGVVTYVLLKPPNLDYRIDYP